MRERGGWREKDTNTTQQKQSIRESLKNIIKVLIPNFVLTIIQIIRAQKRTSRFKSQSARTQEIFSEIYEKYLWGKSENPEHGYYSGAGSHDKNITTVYLDNVGVFLKSLPTKPNVVDLGCGDFSVGSQIRAYCNNFVACDIVPQLIEHNKQKYVDLNVDFRVLNLVTDELPVGDIIFIRQVLQHLSNEQIQKIIPKLHLNYSYLFLTEHLPISKSFSRNLDMPTGPYIRLAFNSGVVLTAPPFNLKTLGEQIICEPEEAGGIIRTILYKLK
jgi:2-polyprenyl-3-methyl-5-hydroxy-6-metoxy-1,4-benzoquinol methylase